METVKEVTLQRRYLSLVDETNEEEEKDSKQAALAPGHCRWSRSAITPAAHAPGWCGRSGRS